MLIKGILSFPHLFTARAVDANSAPKYSTTILIAASDPQVNEIRAEINKVQAAGFPGGFPTNGKICLADDADHPGYLKINCSSSAENKPAVVDMSRQPVIDPAQVFAGAVAYVNVNFFSYNKPMNKGVAGGLNGVMITGEMGPFGRLDNKPTVDQMFSGIAASQVSMDGKIFQAPVPVAPPTPPVAPAAPPAGPPAYVMTPAADGLTRDQYIAAGWTDDLLIQHGKMLPPGGAKLPWQQ
jgi:hypothetical protein